ncbi:MULTISPECIES: hypothetical protein [unclassified Sphingomonas]|jgi:hypothetical protein|uniref:hypothetical protein n=2 Tax=Sphingomonas TaxID=13687 RepID=UPI000ACF7E04|nr:MULTISPECIES: hypothetical protein [unclassified Sphingomonas]
MGKLRLRRSLAVLICGSLSMPVAAQAMTVEQFLTKSRALRAKGLLAMGSPDIKLLRDEVVAAGADYRADLARDKAAGRQAHSCPPPAGKANVNARDLIAEFEAIPAATARTTSVKAAFYAMMKKRFPCPAK